MKKALLLVAAPIVLWSCSESKTSAPTTEAPKDSTATTATEPAHTMPDSATAMKNWEAYATPGTMQQLLASRTGEWTGECTMWMSPDAPPMKSKTSAVSKMILGGRYIESVHTGDMMGMPFEGKSITAYDNARKVFQSTWIDNMGTGIMIMEGTWDEATHALTMTGKMVMGEMGDGSMGDFKEVVRMEDADHEIMEMYKVENGKEIKTMEIHSERKK